MPCLATANLYRASGEDIRQVNKIFVSQLTGLWHLHNTLVDNPYFVDFYIVGIFIKHT